MVPTSVSVGKVTRSHPVAVVNQSVVVFGEATIASFALSAIIAGTSAHLVIFPLLVGLGGAGLTVRVILRRLVLGLAHPVAAMYDSA